MAWDRLATLARDFSRFKNFKRKLRIEYPPLEKGELYAVQLPQGQQFLRDFEKNKIKGIFALGFTGSGKSNCTENLTEFFVRRQKIVIDLHSVYWENLFWARKYKVILVQAPAKFTLKSNVSHVKVYNWFSGYDWMERFQEAQDENAILCTSCARATPEHYTMLNEFVDFLLSPKNQMERIVLSRDLAGLMSGHGQLKESSSKELVELRRKLLEFVRIGRKVGNRIITDTQVKTDIMRAFRDNIWCEIYNRILSTDNLPGLPEGVEEEIKGLSLGEAIINYGGQWFGTRFPLNKCHKNEFDRVEELGLEIVENDDFGLENSYGGEDMPKDLPPIRDIEKVYEEEGLPNDEQTANQRALYAHYAALRTIARQEYLKAGVSENVIDQVLEVDFPSDPTVRIWTYKDVVNSLGLKVLTDTVGKNYRFYSKRIDNNVKERIGLRFIRHLVAQTPDFPTQTFYFSGVGVRDVEFRVNDRLVASGNVKLFLDDHPSRQIHLSPEYKDPVHYGLVVKAKPFRLLVFRGTGEEYVAEGSVRVLGWSGFIEDLKAIGKQASE